ncbi:hypothetical protein Dsin_022732 [Dipteronia sinensis]|uniref:HAT C-terminal dimerisation domain-containing protein n=1 Tax=Dipteronia sinensis TaxID=43782 RepID=A0AAE0E1F0_9ROSI|nr:hypothetical protein Dsin_022732 [Dipteronia sinensis]
MNFLLSQQVEDSSNPGLMNLKLARIQYRICLNASVDCARFLLRQGLAFRGDKEYEESSNRGNFLELYRFLADHNENIKATTLQNAQESLKLTAYDIQKDIAHALVVETTNTIIREIGDALFSILIDESRDVSTKEQMAMFYPKDFPFVDLMILDCQLETYIMDMRSSDEFLKLKGITELAKMMVAHKKDEVFPLVYLLLTLVLILLVATATVERSFSAMNIIKTRLRNRMGDQWMNDNLVVYIEKDISDGIDNETIMQHFQKMKPRQGQL